MANRKIREDMILAGVSISDLANKIGRSERETVEMLNNELGVMQHFNVMYAISEITRERKGV